MGQVIWSDPSIEDLEDIFNFYKVKSLTVAINMIEGIEESGNKLHPNFLHQREPELEPEHRRVVYRYYKIIYEVVGDNIEILRVFDGRKDPNNLTIDE